MTAKTAQVHVWFGKGRWVMSEDPAEIDRLNKVAGLTPMVLGVSSLPEDKLTLEEFFQEHVVKEELPLVIETLKDKPCCMSAAAASICELLMEGKEVWDGNQPEDEED